MRLSNEGMRPAGTRWRAAAPASMWTLLMVACLATAVAIRTTVAGEWLDDTASLALTFATGLVLGAAALVALRLTLRRAGWRRRLAAAIVPVGLAAICVGFVVASLPDASVEMEAIVEAHGPQSPPATVELGPKGDDIRLSGEIQDGVAKRLAALLDANPHVTRVALTSEGGLADEGQAIGDVIAAHGVTTFVPDYCVSACTLAFVRGRQRLIVEDARVGFHSPFEMGLFGAVYQGDSSEQRSQYLAAGLTRDFVDAALRVKPDDIWYPKPAQLIAAHVATSVVDEDRLPDSNLDGVATLEGARNSILANFPVLDAFRTRSPTALDRVAGWYLDAYRRERPEAENNRNLRAIVSSAVLVALTRADDAALVEVGRYLRRGMAAAQGDADACLRIGAGADLLEAEMQLERTDSDADAGAKAVVAAAVAGHRELRAGGDGGPLARIAGDWDDVDASHCAAARRAYDRLLGRPPAEAAAALRSLADSAALRSLAEVRTIIAVRR